MKYTLSNTVAILKPVRVYRDGVEINDCVEADDVEGYAICAVRDASGNLVQDGEDFKLERLTGRIEVKPK